MKKIPAVITVLLLTTIMLAGCGNDQPPVPTGPSVTASQNGPKVTPADTSDFVGEDRAKEIALERAGVNADSVVFDRIELDFDNGVWEYEIEFRQGRTEYDTEIKADDGTILSWEVDND